MSRKAKSPLRFWQELKRRGVPKVIAMYAATAFIIMEAVDIMLPRLGLPDWTVTLVIILLIIGLPVAFVLSWIFDITPQGVVKTGSLEELEISEESEEAEVPRRRKLRTSDVIIALLLIVVLVLAYPKIFGRWDSDLPREMRGKISLAVMPFKNMTGDSIYNLWQEGIQNLLITSLSNSQELSVRQFETMNNLLSDKSGVNYASLTPSLAGEMARKVDANTVISGTMHKAGQKVRITAIIMNAATQEIYKSYEMEGHAEDELFDLADSLSYEIRDFLELRNIKQSQFFDAAQVYTTSSEAYKYYLQGISYHLHLNYPRANEYYNKAIQVDSNFVSAMMRLAFCCGDQQQSVLSKHWAYEAFERIDRLPTDMQLMVHTVKAAADKLPMEQIGYARQYLEIHPYSAYMVYMVAWVYFNLEQWDEAIKGFEENLAMLKKLDDHPWAWTYILLGGAYHNMGSHKQEEKIFNEGREFWPDQKATFDYWQAICAVSRADSADADFYLREIDNMLDQRGWPETFVWLWYARVYDEAESFKIAETYYRKAVGSRPDDPYVAEDFARFLISRDVNVSEGLELIAPIVDTISDNASFLYTYALGLFKTGEYVEAQKVLQKSWDLTPYYDHKQFTLGKKVRDSLSMN
jgi:TolB-like protein